MIYPMARPRMQFHREPLNILDAAPRAAIRPPPLINFAVPVSTRLNNFRYFAVYANARWILSTMRIGTILSSRTKVGESLDSNLFPPRLSDDGGGSSASN